MNGCVMLLERLFTGEIEISSFADEHFEQCENVLQSFYKYEIACIGTEINHPKSIQARTDLTILCKEVANDGVSLIAKDVKLNKVVGVAFNKIQVLTECSFFEDFMNNRCKSENSKALMKFMIDVDAKFDLFQYFNTDCIFELMFLGTLVPEYAKKSIGKMLTFYSMQLAEELKNGQDTNILPEYSKEVRPAAFSAIFTSNFSQKIGLVLGMESLQSTLYSEFCFNGKTFDERIGNGHASCILSANRL